jgi:Domain of unknown function (DUF4202)
MNRSLMRGLSRDFISGGSAARTIGRRCVHGSAPRGPRKNDGALGGRYCAARYRAASVANRVKRAMSEDGKRLSEVIAAIDAANARDPNKVESDGRLHPAELVYGRRMSETLARMAPHASEHLRIAARGQHIERWTSPRAGYAAGRVGYLKWRKDLQRFHAQRIGDIMVAAGYDAGDIERVGALIRKERLKSDADAQMIEDVACVVFLEHYLADFLAKTDQDKLADILAKTWNKLALPAPVPLLLEQGLARLRPGG